MLLPQFHALYNNSSSIQKLHELRPPVLARPRPSSLGLEEPSPDRLDDLESKDARPGSLSLRCDLTHRVAAGGGAKSRQAQLPRHKLYPALAAGAGFTIFIYTKLSTFPSRKIF